MKRNYLFAILFTITTVVLTACEDHSPDDLIAPMPEAITYTEHIRPIINNNCIHCHATVPVNGAPMPLTSYDEIKQAVLQRGLLNRISRENGTAGLMPMGGPRLPEHQIQTIMEWANNGLPQ